MWHTGSKGDVTCIACGTEVSRSQAREYDKYGDRWERRDKQFEFLCKPCDRACCHQPRDGLETDLIRAEAGKTDRETFLTQYHDIASNTREEPERER
jgi:hypothetical protein